MSKSMAWKLALIVAVVGLSAWSYLARSLNLGLDLKGGMHLILEVQTDDAIRVQTDQSVAQLRTLLTESGVKDAKVHRVSIREMAVEGYTAEDEGRVREIVNDEFTDWTFAVAPEKTTLVLKPLVEKDMREQAVNQALETIRNRVDEFGVSEPVIQKEGMSGDRILVQLPGVDAPDRVKNIIRSTAMLEFKAVAAGPFETEAEALQQYNNTLPEDLEVVKADARRMSKGYYVLKSAAVVTGKDLKNARSSRDEYGALAVGFSFNAQGAKKFERYTAANIGQRLSVVLDRKVMSVATVEGVISYDGILKGQYTPQEVKDMVLVLKSGALPAEVKWLEERTIGPSLGADSIRKGVTAALVGLLLVILFMLVYYKAAGINSVLALVFNIVILLGVMAYFRASLTLPGIAGIILTIGMAVDANVLIFERIKEELRAGVAPKSAIEVGFGKAFVTIFDANLTTIIAAIFLFQFGTGPIKGFSVTLIVGILASMFTAVFVSRVIFDLVYGARKKVDKLSI